MSEGELLCNRHLGFSQAALEPKGHSFPLVLHFIAQILLGPWALHGGKDITMLITFSALGTCKVKFCGTSCVATYRHRVLILFHFFLNSWMFWIRLTPLHKEMNWFWDLRMDSLFQLVLEGNLDFFFWLSDADLQIGKLMWGDSGLYYCIIITPDDVEGKNEESVELLVLGKLSCRISSSVDSWCIFPSALLLSLHISVHCITMGVNSM